MFHAHGAKQQYSGDVSLGIVISISNLIQDIWMQSDTIMQYCCSYTQLGTYAI